MQAEFDYEDYAAGGGLGAQWGIELPKDEPVKIQISPSVRYTPACL